MLKDVSDSEKSTISGRIDVENTGTSIFFKNGTVNDNKCDILAIDENFAPNMGMKLTQGTFPKAENELMLENWAMERYGLKPGDTVSFAFEDSIKKSFVVSGVFSDYASTKASGEPGVVISISAANKANAEKTNAFLIQFKDRTNMRKAEKQITETLDISEDRIGRNDRLLAVIGQSDYKAATGIYETGAILFLIVLVAGVVMIYNTFNISVMERVRQFGLLRCVGASKAQIKKLVKREGTILILKALPYVYF
jgi:putative ABC transport system permease protein